MTLLSRRTAVALAAAVWGASCSFHVNPNQGLFSCNSDRDCGGGYQCIPQLGGAPGLCFPIGQCGAGQCCDVAHDGGDLFSDDANCGACGHACAAGTGCDGGVCRETNCADGIDNDGNGLTDCDDPNCPGRPCAGDAGSVCGLAWVPVDAGGPANPDAGTDAGAPDAGPSDAGAADGGAADGGPADAGTLDGGALDGGGADAGTADAGPFDGGEDAGVDAGVIDAGYVQVPACIPG
jgi:hypothetical protein